MCVSGVKANDHIWWRRQWSSTIVTLILVAKHNLCHRLIDVIFLESKYPVMTKHRTHHTIPCHSDGWTCLTDFNMLTAHLTTVLFKLNCWIDWSVCLHRSSNTFIKFCFNILVFFFLKKRWFMWHLKCYKRSNKKDKPKRKMTDDKREYANV